MRRSTFWCVNVHHLPERISSSLCMIPTMVYHPAKTQLHAKKIRHQKRVSLTPLVPNNQPRSALPAKKPKPIAETDTASFVALMLTSSYSFTSSRSLNELS